jgi:hypothetical protein
MTEQEYKPMDGLVRFEIKADAFHRMTGMTAPGKDDAYGTHSPRERFDAWVLWIEKYEEVVESIFQATDHILDMCFEPCNG